MTRWGLAAALGLALLCKAEASIDVILDLDGTLVYSFPEGDSEIWVRGIPYGLAPGAVEFLIALQEVPGLRISFFSSGKEERNTDLLKQLSQLVYQASGVRIHYYLFSENSIAADGRKDLRKLKQHFNLDSTILIDDFAANAEEDQKRNLLRIYPGLGQNLKDQKLAMLVQCNLAWAIGLILDAIDFSNFNRVSLVDALTYLQQSSRGINTQRVYSRGMSVLGSIRIDSRFSSVPFYCDSLG